VEILPNCRPVILPQPSLLECKTWENIFGDSGAAGQLLIATHRNRSIYLPFSDPENPLRLITEAIELLPVKDQWKRTFSTYIAGDCDRDCCIKFFPEPTPSHLTIPNGQIFKFSQSELEFAEKLPVEIIAARTGTPIVVPGRLQGVQAPTSSEKYQPALELNEPTLIAEQPLLNGRQNQRTKRRSNVGKFDRPPSLPPSQLQMDADPNSYPIDPETTKVGGIVLGIVGLSVGICLALAGGLPFLLNYQTSLKTEKEKHNTTQTMLDETRFQLSETQESLAKELRTCVDLKGQVSNLKEELEDSKKENDTLEGKLKDEQKRTKQSEDREKNLQLKLAELQKVIGSKPPKKLLSDDSHVKFKDQNFARQLKSAVNTPGADQDLMRKAILQFANSTITNKLSVPIPFDKRIRKQEFKIPLKRDILTISSLQFVGIPEQPLSNGFSFESKGDWGHLKYNDTRIAKLEFEDDKYPPYLRLYWLENKQFSQWSSLPFQQQLKASCRQIRYLARHEPSASIYGKQIVRPQFREESILLRFGQ
ncbi:MAG: hypothetical protein AAF623_18640, partial [Planctomycetota bacterium]